jgi:hypothetical protein
MASAVGDVAGNGLLQVVDVVDEDAVKLVHGRINIARNGDVDKEHGAVLSAGQEQLAVLAAEDGVRGTGRCNDDVGPVAGIVQIFEMDRLPFEFIGKADGPVIGAIGDEDGSATMGHQMARSQLAHLAGADQVNVLAVKIAEDLFGQFHRD